MSGMVAMSIDPGSDVCGVESQEVSPLDIRDPAFLDETADVANVDAEPVGDFSNSHERARGLLLVF